MSITNDKIWFGDINVTISNSELEENSKELNEKIYIFTKIEYKPEIECMFENENSLINYFLTKTEKNA